MTTSTVSTSSMKATSGNPQHKMRSRFLIYPKFQLSLLGFNIAVVTIGFAVILFGYHLFMTNLHQRGVASGLSANHY